MVIEKDIPPPCRNLWYHIYFFVFFNLLTEQNQKNAIEANKVSSAQIMQSIDVSLKSIDLMVVNDIMSEPVYEKKKPKSPDTSGFPATCGY
jgi:hypothetical protein